jgi:segregation and condensation protein B
MQEVEEERETVADEPQGSGNESERETGSAEAALEPEIVPDADESTELAPATAEDAIVIAEAITEPPSADDNYPAVKAVIEAALYITDAPLSPEQIAAAVEQPLERVKEILTELVAEYNAPHRGLSVRELAGGFKMNTKPEYHESIRRFVKNLQPPLKLSLPALETLAVVAYKQPITAPEIMDVRGVQGTGVLKTLLDRKLIAAAGRKNVMGKPILYKTTREFLIQFGLSSLAELPTLKEFEELGRLALSDGDEYAAEAAAPAIAEEGAMQEQSLLAETTKTVEAAETSAAETTDENTTPAELKEEDTAEEAASEQQTNG